MKRFSIRAAGLIALAVGLLLLTGCEKIDVVPKPDQEQDHKQESPEYTVFGYVKCGSTPVADVVVSDGYEVVKTDANGLYQMKSMKACGYVFISVPSGYEVESVGVMPQFHKYLSKAPNVQERVDFTLYDAGDQTNHTMLYFGDMHLAARTNDRNQFKTFTSEIYDYVSKHASDKVYAMTLGDMTWDLYWYSNNYCFAQYLSDVNAIRNLQIFHTIGNHDHDMRAAGDWDTVLRFRKDMCPNYYSFNIGDVHYMSIDDIICTNPGSGTTRTYNKGVSAECLNWIRKDLSFVDKSKRIVLAMHAPVYTYWGSSALANTAALESALSGYNVTFVTGHTHILYTVYKGSIKEQNSGAVCAAWWWAGKYNSTLNLGTDGGQGGYRITTVKGTSETSFFKVTGRNENYQFRTYDRNQISESSFSVPSSRMATFKNEDASKGNYCAVSSANEVIINVWDYDTKWKVEVTENGKSLTVTRFEGYDPAFLLAYTAPRLNENSSFSWNQSKTNHLFKVRASSASSTLIIKVTDDEGRVYTETMTRPKAFTIANYR